MGASKCHMEYESDQWVYQHKEDQKLGHET